MPPTVKPRAYRSTVRPEQAERTRAAILTAARDLFAAHGYAGTTVRDIAAAAGVAPDTVYASVGRKPQIFRLLIETALSGRDVEVPGEQREYVARMRATRSAAEQLAIYAGAVTAISKRLAPLQVVLSDAASHAPELLELRRQISQRRADNMRHLVADLATTGELRDDVSHDEIADVIWATNSPEFFTLLVSQRGFSLATYEKWLTDLWTRSFLRQ